MKKQLWLVLAAGAGGLTACDSAPVAPTSEASPQFAIVDGRHGGGNPRFFFLPPIVADPNTSGTFDAAQSPEVHICELAITGCSGPPIAHYTMNSGLGGETVSVDVDAQHYALKWRTRDLSLDLTKIYRIEVSTHGHRLGFADVQLVASGGAVKNVNTDEYIPLIDGHILNLKFRIDHGIFPLMVTYISGDGQVSPAGTILQMPLVVRVTDASGYPMENVEVLFSEVLGGGTVSTPTAISDASGLAEVFWTLGAAGAQAVTASLAGAAGSPIAFSATAISPAPAWCGSFLDFSGNVLPPSWDLPFIVRGGPGVINERLEARPIDSGTRIAVAAGAAGLTNLVIEYDGISNQSFWGTHHGFGLMSGSTVLTVDAGNAVFNFGAGNLGFRLTTGSALWPFGSDALVSQDLEGYDPGTHRYRIDVTPSFVTWTATNTVTNRTATGTLAMPNTFDLNTVSGFYFYVYETTGAGTWADNIRITCQ